MINKTQQESEANAKVYQVDAIAQSLAEIKEMIKEQNTTYVTKDSFALAIQKLDAKDTAQEKEMKQTNTRINGWKKFAVSIALVVATLFINAAWQYIMNSGRAHD